ncbi:hypothetical protein HYQ45_010995 [Verticillium longisporum]|uniref:Uncharacterized protein n=1 Tax=Verticillium longisporum TaxID=100787 RepID=A0A8I2ZGW4_VERLO|nr:hypothetical protein HYQ45_010995 [Verticillium longisporum]
MASSNFITISLNPGFLAAPAGPRAEPPPLLPSSSDGHQPPRASQAQAQRYTLLQLPTSCMQSASSEIGINN